MPTRRVDLILRPVGARCSVLLDGEEVKNCRAVTIDASCGEVTRVTLELVNVEAYVKSEDLTDANVRCYDVTPITADIRSYALLKQAEENERILIEDDNGGEPSKRLQ